MKAVPPISVCVPTYNGGPHLRACLDSVLAQTLTDFEVLIVDDCSTDETLAIAAEYVERDSRFRLIKNERNLGLVGNWNRCIELAQGDWIKFVFQDDLIAPPCLAEMLAASSPDTWLTVCRRDFIFEDGTTEDTRSYYEQHTNSERVFGVNVTYVGPESVCVAAIDLLGVNFFGEPTAIMIRREAFARYGVFNPELSMICDMEYWVRVAVHHGFSYVPKTLASFRVHAGSTSAHHFAKRQYRITLDGVVLMSEYVHNPVFKPMRTATRERDPIVDLKATLYKKIGEARWIAVDAATNETSPNPALLVEWEELLARHPNLRQSTGVWASLRKRLAGLWRR